MSFDLEISSKLFQILNSLEFGSILRELQCLYGKFTLSDFETGFAVHDFIQVDFTFQKHRTYNKENIRTFRSADPVYLETGKC